MCVEKIITGCVKNYATCIAYEGNIPSFSDLFAKSCRSLANTTEDIYKYIEDFYQALSTDGLEDYCITFDTDAEGKITQRQVNLGLVKEVCELKTQIEALGGGTSIDMTKLDLQSCELNLTTFVDACGASITDVCGLFQALVDKILAQQVEIDALNVTVASQAGDISTLQTTLTSVQADIVTLQSYHP